MLDEKNEIQTAALTSSDIHDIRKKSYSGFERATYRINRVFRRLTTWKAAAFLMIGTIAWTQLLVFVVQHFWFGHSLAGHLDAAILALFVTPGVAAPLIVMCVVTIKRLERAKRRERHAVEALSARLHELRQANRRRRRAETESQAKSTFLAHMSHELRTPLNAIIGFSETIEQQIWGPVGHENYRGYAKDIHDAGRHLLSLIDDILDVSKVEAGHVELDDQPLDIRAVVEGCVRLVRQRGQQAGLTIDTKLPADLPALRVDPRLTKQIVLNLLSNAIKFSPVGGEIRVDVRIRDDGWLALSIDDTGIGISAADIERCLLPFGRAEGTLARRYEGTGLGLPLSKAFAELHGATLTIDSQIGVGTTVSVCFPPDRLLRHVAA